MWYNYFMEQSKKQEYIIVSLLALSLIIGTLSPLFGLIGIGAIFGYSKRKNDYLPKDFTQMVIASFVVLGVYFVLSIIFNVKVAMEEINSSSSALALIFI